MRGLSFTPALAWGCHNGFAWLIVLPYNGTRFSQGIWRDKLTRSIDTYKWYVLILLLLHFTHALIIHPFDVFLKMQDTLPEYSHWDIALPAPEVDPRCETLLKWTGKKLGTLLRPSRGPFVKGARERSNNKKQVCHVRILQGSEGEWVLIGGFCVELDGLLTDETWFLWKDLGS